MARDNRRTHQQRNQRAFDQGYRGKGGGVKGAYAAERKAREEGRPLPTDRTARPDLRQVIRLPDGRRLVNPKGGQGDKVARSQLRKGRRFTLRATIQTDTGVREVELFGKGGWRADELRRLMDDFGSLDAAVADMIDKQGGNGDGMSNGVNMPGGVPADAVLSVELDIL